MKERTPGARGQCEVIDLVPTEDDAVAVRCVREGVCIRESVNDRYVRLRFVCRAHGQEGEVN